MHRTGGIENSSEAVQFRARRGGGDQSYKNGWTLATNKR
jgi:hypothetical protein